MNREELKKILPHREPMLILDSAELNEDGSACGRYHVNGDEWFLQGHFPDNPIVPGVIQCEIAAQTCAVLLGETVKGKTPLYTGIDRARFRRIVRSGETMIFTVTLTKSRPPFFFAHAECKVDGETAMSCDLSFAVT